MASLIRGLNGRLLLIPLVTLLALATVGVLSSIEISSVTLDDHQSRARVAVDAGIAIVDMYADRAARGEMTTEAAQTAAKDAVRAIRFDGSEYVAVLDAAGTTIAHFNPKIEGKSFLEVRDANGAYSTKDLLSNARNGGGFNYNMFPKAGTTEPVRKVTYSRMPKNWGWTLASGVYLDNVDAMATQTMLKTGGVIGVMAVVAIGVTLLIGLSITRPIKRLIALTGQIAGGNFAVSVPDQGRRDEIGTLAKAIDVLRDRSLEATTLAAQQEAMKSQVAQDRQKVLHELAGAFEVKVGSLAGLLASESTQMEGTARSMTATAGHTSAQASQVAAAALQASGGVQTVAAAAEELAASINEISRQVAEATKVTGRAVSDAQRTDTIVQTLADSAAKVGQVVGLISNIASQTNLLALNATIEAARAGDAGKGFAVVASEVKNLATQTARATEEIGIQIGDIQGATQEAVKAIRDITAAIGDISTIATGISSAVHEQGAATSEIARNVQQTSQATQNVSATIGGVRQSTDETVTAAGLVLNAAAGISGRAEQLSTDVARFVAEVRAA